MTQIFHSESDLKLLATLKSRIIGGVGIIGGFGRCNNY